MRVIQVRTFLLHLPLLLGINILTPTIEYHQKRLAEQKRATIAFEKCHEQSIIRRDCYLARVKSTKTFREQSRCFMESLKKLLTYNCDDLHSPAINVFFNFMVLRDDRWRLVEGPRVKWVEDKICPVRVGEEIPKTKSDPQPRKIHKSSQPRKEIKNFSCFCL